MNQPPNQKLYNGFADAAIQLVSKGGPQALYKGFFQYGLDLHLPQFYN